MQKKENYILPTKKVPTIYFHIIDFSSFGISHRRRKNGNNSKPDNYRKRKFPKSCVEFNFRIK